MGRVTGWDTGGELTQPASNKRHDRNSRCIKA